MILGLLGTWSTATDLLGYLNGDPIVYTSSKFGTLSGRAAIAATGAMFVVGAVLIAWGVLVFKKANNGNT